MKVNFLYIYLENFFYLAENILLAGSFWGYLADTDCITSRFQFGNVDNAGCLYGAFFLYLPADFLYIQNNRVFFQGCFFFILFDFVSLHAGNFTRFNILERVN